MKWFKHISDSLDDPFIFDLKKEFKADGYLVFFGTLEIYAREFSPKDDWKLIISWSYLHQKLGISRAKIKKILSKIYKWEVSFTDTDITILIPKFKDLIDNWTLRQIPKTTESLQSNYPTNKNKEEEVDKEKDTNKGIKPSRVFQIPSLEEVSLYCKERKNKVNPEGFISHYNSNGWMVGKNKMRDWKSAIITWEKNYFGGDNGNSKGFNTHKGFVRTDPNWTSKDDADVDEINRKWAAKKAAALNQPKENA